MIDCLHMDGRSPSFNGRSADIRWHIRKMGAKAGSHFLSFYWLRVLMWSSMIVFRHIVRSTNCFNETELKTGLR